MIKLLCEHTASVSNFTLKMEVVQDSLQSERHYCLNFSLHRSIRAHKGLRPEARLLLGVRAVATPPPPEDFRVSCSVRDTPFPSRPSLLLLHEKWPQIMFEISE
jgi:hypothetical protein